MSDFEDIMDSPEFFVKNQDYIIKYMILTSYFDMMKCREDYMKSKLNNRMDMLSFDGWTAGLIKIYTIIKDSMVRDDTKGKMKGELTKTISFMDEITINYKRPDEHNLNIATIKITSYFKKSGLLEFERKKDLHHMSKSDS